MQARYAIWHTVKALDQQYMEAQLARAGTPSPRVIRKGHTYRIVVSDLLRGRPDRSEASLSEFYAWLGEKKSTRIRLAVMTYMIRLQANWLGSKTKVLRCSLLELTHEL
jgi:hypothetical protein